MRLNKLALACVVLGGSALMAACGGGGGGGGGVTPTTNLSLSGTAALGAPAVGPVTATCRTGTGTAVSNADGSFTVNVVNGVGPCLLALTPPGGSPIYSFSTGAGSSVANITPMTNLLVTYLLSVPGVSAADPAAWFALPATKALLADPVALNKRVVEDFIPAVKILVPGLSLTGTNFLSTAFTASPTGSATDADLEKLKVAGVVSATGAPAPAATATLKVQASNDAVVPPAPPATGAGS